MRCSIANKGFRFESQLAYFLSSLTSSPLIAIFNTGTSTLKKKDKDKKKKKNKAPTISKADIGTPANFRLVI